MYAPGPKHLWIGLLVLIVIRFVALGVVEQSRTERSRNGIDCLHGIMHRRVLQIKLHKHKCAREKTYVLLLDSRSCVLPESVKFIQC